MTDKELEEMGFGLVKHGMGLENPHQIDFLVHRERLKAGVEGAKAAIAALKFLVTFFQEKMPLKELDLLYGIQNLKTFLGEDSEKKEGEK